MSFFSELFHGRTGYKNPAKSAQPYFDQIPGQTNPYHQPYFDAGTDSLGKVKNNYDQDINNPGGRVNDIGQNYHQSPGFQFALQQALGAGDHAAAAGGMAGSPEHQQRNMGIATGLADQDYNQWLTNALGVYGQGLNGENDVSHMGQNAGKSMADTIAQTLAQQGGLNYTGQQNKNQNNSNTWSNIGNGIGALGAFTPWGNIGSAVGGFFGGSR